MQFVEAISQNVPLQVYLPSATSPLDRRFRYVAETFLVETTSGIAVAWLEPYWPTEREHRVCQICYADPVEKTRTSWVDNRPRFGPFCIAYQNPFLMERVAQDGPLWRAHLDWLAWCHARRTECLRSKAWQRVESDLASIQPRRLA